LGTNTIFKKKEGGYTNQFGSKEKAGKKGRKKENPHQLGNDRVENDRKKVKGDP